MPWWGSSAGSEATSAPATAPSTKVLGFASVFSILFFGKLLILEVVNIVFGDEVDLGHFVEIAVLIVAMIVARGAMQWIYDRLGDSAAIRPARVESERSGAVASRALPGSDGQLASWPSTVRRGALRGRVVAVGLGAVRPDLRARVPDRRSRGLVPDVPRRLRRPT